MANTTTEVRGVVVGDESIAVSTTVVGFTTATAFPSGAVEPDLAVVTVASNTVRYRVSGLDPTGSVGHGAPANTSISIYGTANIKRAKFIRESADATIFVTYYRQAGS